MSQEDLTAVEGDRTLKDGTKQSLEKKVLTSVAKQENTQNLEFSQCREEFARRTDGGT